ncbi:MAG: hypothetical protein ACRDV9_07905, partial [Acidimicrobiia bacterium]
YSHVFGFSESSSLGVAALVADPAGRFAMFSAIGADGTKYGLVAPFHWEGNRVYFTYVYRLSPGTWGMWIYDQAAGTWTLVGVLDLPAGWGKLAATSVTGVDWYGPNAPTCSAYPSADLLVYPAVGYVGSTATTPSLIRHGTKPGDCRSETSSAYTYWTRYRTGAGA